MVRALFIVTVLISTAAFGAGEYTESGYLDGPGDSDSWDMNLESKFVDVVFTWPLSGEYWVTVYGMHGDELGNFNLNEGETIQLSGGGKFTIKIYSVKGAGSWTATWEDRG